ncbi:MAG: hypothetical protein ACRCY4_10070, partial [Brevinema sp.]
MNKKYLSAAMATLFLIQPLYAFRSRFIVPNNQLEDVMLTDYDSVSPVEAALVASGIPEQNIARYASEFKRWESEIRASLPPNATEHATAERILQYIHKNVFSKYNLSSTTLAEVFQNGQFNCVSSTIVNGLLLQAFGIEVKGVVLPTHVYLLAVLDGKPTEVENTISQGLQISQDKRLQDQFNSLTGFTYGGATRKNVISWAETTGILYSNRSYFDAQRRQYEQAFQNMMKAQALLASAPSEQSNLTAGYLNYSYYAFQSKNRPSEDYLKALEVLQEGIERYKGLSSLKGNYSSGVGILLQRMITNNTSNEEIDNFLESSRPYMPARDYSQLVEGRYPQQLQYYLKDKKDYEAAKSVLSAWYAKNPNGKEQRAWVRNYFLELIQNDLRDASKTSPNPQLVNDLSVYPVAISAELFGHYYSQIAQRLFNARRYEAAVALMEDALQNYGRQQLITDNGFAMAVNSAVQFFNQSNYEQALGFYKRALVFKNNNQVSRDMVTVYGNLA